MYTLSSLDTSSSLYGTGHDYSIAPDSGSNRRMPNGADLETTPTINEMGGDVDLSKDEGESSLCNIYYIVTLSEYHVHICYIVTNCQSIVYTCYIVTYCQSIVYTYAI